MKRLLLILLMYPLLCFSQGYQVNLQGQKQQGMASAGSALALDASSLFFNPGTASMLENNSVLLNFTPTFSKGVFQDANNDEIAHTTSPMGTPFALYAVFGLDKIPALKFGLAVYTPFGSTVSWEDGWSGRYALTRLKLLSIFTQPTISYKIGEKLGVGAGFVYSYGKVSLQKDLPLTFQDGRIANAELAGAGGGFGFNAGIHYSITDFISIAASYRSRIMMSVDDGQATFNVPESVDDKFPDGSFSSALPLPQVITGAIAIEPTDKLKIAFDMNFIDWTAYDTLAFDYDTNTESLEDTKSARNYKATFTTRLGGSYQFHNKWTGRLGIAYALTPVQDGYVTPETPDADRINYSAGFSYNLNDKMCFDFSILYTYVSRTDTNLETNLSGTFQTRVIAPGFAFNYNF